MFGLGELAGVAGGSFQDGPFVPVEEQHGEWMHVGEIPMPKVMYLLRRWVLVLKKLFAFDFCRIQQCIIPIRTRGALGLKDLVCF